MSSSNQRRRWGVPVRGLRGRGRRQAGAVVTAAALGAVLAACGLDTADPGGSATPTALSSTSSPAAGAAGAAGAQASTDVIPITLKDGTVPLVTVSVGGGPEVPVQLDTGSAGLRILREAVGPATTPLPSSSDDNITFVDGTTYHNERASATVRIGGVAIPDPVTVAVVNDVTCEPKAMACTPGTAATKSDGQYGILGVDLDSSSGRVPSPLLALAQWRSFHVAYGNAGRGELRSGLPTSAALSTWPLRAADSGVPQVQGWAQDFRACWKTRSVSDACVDTTFDTGATDVVVPPDFTPGLAAGDALNASDGTLQLLAAEAPNPVWTLSPGDTAQSSVYVGASDDSGYSGVLAGAPIFYAFDVAIDQSSGRIGLYPRTMAQ